MEDYRARLCHIRKWPDFNGYGFNLHAEKGKAGQYIGSVDADSPSQAAGLKAGDRIVEVNGVNIGNENHQQVVQRIKSVPNETRLLVVDPETDKFYRSNNIVASSESPGVIHLEAPLINPYTNAGLVEEDESERSDFTSSHFKEEMPKEPPRLCILRRWPDFDGYGFNLHSEKGKPGQFIGKVDGKSPAEASGLRKGDWIVEINGENVMEDLHQDVVAKIKSRPNEVSMLVVDNATDKFYKERGVMVSGDMRSVQTIECPHVNPHTGQRIVEEVNNGTSHAFMEDDKRSSNTGSDDASLTASQDEELGHSDMVDNGKAKIHYDAQPSQTSYGSTSSAYTHSMERSTYSAGGNDRISSDFSTRHDNSVDNTMVASEAVVGGIHFAASAKEARERMRKKKNVKEAGMTAKDKYDLLMRL